MVKEDRASQEKGGAGEGCPVEMQGGKRCGRPIHTEPGSTYDEEYVCLMHSRDPRKSEEEFQREFEATLEAAGKSIADFAMFVFPSAKYRRRKFAAVCRFEGATFSGHADFSQAEFTRDAYFRSAAFMQTANFNGAMFSQDAYFGGATFTQNVSFPEARFTKDADFNRVRFTQVANFRGATFGQEARFEGVWFTWNVSFNRATFVNIATFNYATFAQNAKFKGATFRQKARFEGTGFTTDVTFNRATFLNYGAFNDATFTQDADFSGATFALDANFSAATFAQKVDFSGAAFTQGVVFRRAKFLGATEFRETDIDPKMFRRDDSRLPGADFSMAEFAQPERVRFYKTYLGQALFYNGDVSKVNFSLVEWRRRKGSRRWMAVEEEVDFRAAPDLKTQGGAIDERRYWLIVELYQQLKKNYDERKDYGTAGDFHYGELEMRRLATGPPGLLFRAVTGKILEEQSMNAVRRWWHQQLSLVAWYKYASQYGESYARPALWLGVVLLSFAVLYPVFGLRYEPAKEHAGIGSDAPVILSYGNPLFPGQLDAHRHKAQLRLFGNSLLTAVEIAGFQKEPAYQPVYPWGRVLTLLEMVLTSTLAALFFLAVRRQFRR